MKLIFLLNVLKEKDIIKEYVFRDIANIESIELSDAIYTFFIDIVEDKRISNDLVSSCIEGIKNIHRENKTNKISNVEKLLAAIFYEIVHFKLSKNEKQIAKLRQNIEKQELTNHSIKPKTFYYDNIFKLYLLTIKTKICTRIGLGKCFPNLVNPYLVFDHLAFFLNIYILNRIEIDLSYDSKVIPPFFPLNYIRKIDKPNKFIKDITKLYPYERAHKIYDGCTGDTVYKAYDPGKKKIIFIRHPARDRNLKLSVNQDGIFASKIANLIDMSKDKQPSERNFSSERLLNEKRSTASRKLESYLYPIENNFHIGGNIVLTNTGKIHVLLHFLGEKDSNRENLAVSSKNLSSSQCRLVKIDFDHCGFYEKNHIDYDQHTQLLYFIYDGEKHYLNSAKFKQEKFETLLKISFLTKECLQIYADKSFTSEKKKNECLNNANNRVSLTIRYLKKVSKKNTQYISKQLISVTMNAFILYLKKHEQYRDDLSDVISSIKNRAAFLEQTFFSSAKENFLRHSKGFTSTKDNVQKLLILPLKLQWQIFQYLFLKVALPEKNLAKEQLALYR